MLDAVRKAVMVGDILLDGSLHTLFDGTCHIHAECGCDVWRQDRRREKNLLMQCKETLEAEDPRVSWKFFTWSAIQVSASVAPRPPLVERPAAEAAAPAALAPPTAAAAADGAHAAQAPNAVKALDGVCGDGARDTAGTGLGAGVLCRAA